MSVFIKQGDYSNGTPIDGPEISGEFDNIYNALNQSSLDKELNHNFNGTQPSLIVDQLSTGDILQFKVGNNIVSRIDNSGIIHSNDTKLINVFTWFVDNPSTSDEISKIFIPPSNATIIDTFGVIWSGQGVQGNFSQWQLQRQGDPFALSFTLQLDTTTLPNTIIATGINGNPNLSPSDVIFIDNLGLAGSATGFTFFITYFTNELV